MPYSITLPRLFRNSIMSHPDFSAAFSGLYRRALARFGAGNATPATLLALTDVALLTANGITAQHVFDYVEDFTNHGEPSYDEALAIELVRRDYFLNVQHGRPSATVLDAATLPPKNATISGIGWLPRLLPKARAKLRGELPQSMMFCCGGDRAFFQRHRLAAHDFLALISRHEHDDTAIIEWVRQGA